MAVIAHKTTDWQLKNMEGGENTPLVGLGLSIEAKYFMHSQSGAESVHLLVPTKRKSRNFRFL